MSMTNIRRILNRVFRKLAPNDETYVRVLNQYQDFLKNRGPFQDAVYPIVQGTPCHEWWDAMDSEAKALQTIARRIFAQVCSISSCERNWSIYSFVHNKVRNRLQPNHAEDLVYIYTNSRLLRHQRGPNPIQWYGIHQIHSNDKSDGEAPNGEALDGDDSGGHLDIDANMADNNNMGGDNYGFDNIDSSNNVFDGDNSDSGGGGGNTMVVVLNSLVVVVAAVTVLECSTFTRETTIHMLLSLCHLLMTNQGMSHQFKRLALLKVCDKYYM